MVLVFLFYFGQNFTGIFRGNLNAASAAPTQKGSTKTDYRCVNFHRAAHVNGIAMVQCGMLWRDKHPLVCNTEVILFGTGSHRFQNQ